MNSQGSHDAAVKGASELVKQYQNRQITRRQFGVGLIKLGIGASAASVILFRVRRPLHRGRRRHGSRW